MSITEQFKRIGLVAVLCLFSALIASCDFSSKSDLKKAEKAMEKADEVNAKYWAEPEYLKAQRAFDEAVQLDYERKVNECRDKAQDAKDWATEAINLAIKRKAEMEAEQDKLGSYKH